VLAVTLIFAVAIPGLKVETNGCNTSRQDSPAVLGTTFGGRPVWRTYSLSVVGDTGEYDGVKEPECWIAWQVLQDRMGEVDRLSHASSIAELVRNVNKVSMPMIRPTIRFRPRVRAVAQELLLFTMQGGSGLDSMVSYDFQKALVSARAANVPTSELRRTLSMK